jgi:hypothetical protein
MPGEQATIDDVFAAAGSVQTRTRAETRKTDRHPNPHIGTSLIDLQPLVHYKRDSLNASMTSAFADRFTSRSI